MTDGLFNKREFMDFQDRIKTSVKKNIEINVEYHSMIPDVNIKSDSDDEVFKDGNIKIVYEDQEIQVPQAILNLHSLRDIINENTFVTLFQKDDVDRFMKLMPDQEEGSLFTFISQKWEHNDPFDDFQRKLKKGYFTRLWQKERELEQVVAKKQKLDYYKNLLSRMIEKRKKPAEPSFRLSQQEHLSESQISSVEDLEVNNFSDASEETETEMPVMEDNQDGYAGRQMNEVFFRYEDRRKTQEQLISMTDDRTDYKAKATKPLTTVKNAKSADWVETYRKQEEQRYKQPTLPWTYVCQDGRRVTVAPVSRKAPPPGCKPRQHDLLKQQRPACVTILTLVRDAAARLPNGFGTRADICELLKQSQYVNDELDEKLISSIVSGALDRLHYMSDACVKYDNQKKLWLYLHLDRNEQHKWEDNDEFNIKKVGFRKKKGDDYDMDRYD